MSILNRPHTAPNLNDNNNNSHNNNNNQNIFSNSSIITSSSPSSLSLNRPKSHNNTQGITRFRSPVPHSFRYSVTQKGNYKNLNENPSKLMIRSNSTLQISPNRNNNNSNNNSNRRNKDKSPPKIITPPPIINRPPSPFDNNFDIEKVKIGDSFDNNSFEDYQQNDNNTNIQQEQEQEQNQNQNKKQQDNYNYNYNENDENKLFHELRKQSYETTSERDKAALKIGRLILSTILSKPEISVADSISRFFTDVWLSKSGTNSTLSTTDTMSIDLLSNLHRSMTENNILPDASVKQVAVSQKSIAAVACEALDILILTFGKSNPILTDIREALMPVIFMTLPESIDKFKKKDINTPLTGESYLKLPTWCEDTASLVQDLQDFEKTLQILKHEKNEIEEKKIYYKQLYEQMVQENGHAQGKILSSTREQERLRDLYRNLKNQNKTLQEEHTKLIGLYEIDKEILIKEKKVNSQLTIKVEELKDKYGKVYTEKLKLEDIKQNQQQEINYLKSEIITYQQRLIDAGEQYKVLNELNKKYIKDYEEANNYRLNQSRKYKEAMERIEKSVNTPSINFTMGNKVLNLIRSNEPNVIDILESWNIELLERNSALENELASTDVNQIVSSALQAQNEIHQEELSNTIKLHQTTLDNLRKTKDNEIIQMKGIVDTTRHELFETQIDRNRIEDVVKSMELELKELQIKFDGKKTELEKRMELASTTKIRIQDRSDMMYEDHMFEILLRECKSLNRRYVYDIDILVQENTVLNTKILDLEDTLESTNNDLTQKIIELNNLKANSQEMLADMSNMKDRLEILSKPNTREHELEELVLQMQSKIMLLEEEKENMIIKMSSNTIHTLQSQRQLDWLIMEYEDNYGKMMYKYEHKIDEYRKYIKLKEGIIKTLEKKVEDYNILTKCLQRSEQQLMSGEDNFTKTNNLVARVLKAQRSLLASASLSFNEMDESKEFDFSGLDREENELREMLTKEKESHTKTKEKMKDLLSSELVKQHNLKLEKQEVIAQVFRLEESLKELKLECNDYKLQNEKLIISSELLEENILMINSELESLKWNVKQITKDKATDVEDLISLNTLQSPIQSPLQTNRKTSKSSIHISLPKSSSSRRSSKGKSELEGIVDDSDENSDYDDGDGDNDNDFLQSARRGSKSKRKSSTSSVSSSSSSRQRSKSKSILSSSRRSSIENKDSTTTTTILSSRRTSTDIRDSPPSRRTSTIDVKDSTTSSSNRRSSTEVKDLSQQQQQQQQQLNEKSNRKLSNENREISSPPSEKPQKNNFNSQVSKPSRRQTEYLPNRTKFTIKMGDKFVTTQSNMNEQQDNNTNNNNSHNNTEGSTNSIIFYDTTPLSTEETVPSEIHTLDDIPALLSTRTQSNQLEINEIINNLTNNTNNNNNNNNNNITNTSIPNSPSSSRNNNINNNINNNNLNMNSPNRNEDDKKVIPRITQRESIAENDRLVEMAHENAEYLKKYVKFDSSISIQSSSNYFFDILELRERRNIFENSRLKMLLREAAGLVNRLKENLVKFVLKNVRSSNDLCDNNFSLVHKMRNDINENSWIFHMKPEHVIENEVLKDAIFIGGRIRSLADFDNDLITLDHCKDVFPDVKCSVGIDKISRHIQSLKKDVEKSIKRSGSMSKPKWKSVLYRSDGSIDVNMSLTGWTSYEKNEVYAEIVNSIILEMDELEKKHLQEIELLREIVRETEKKRLEEEEKVLKLQSISEYLNNQENNEKNNENKDENYKILYECLTNVTLLLQHLTGNEQENLTKSLIITSSLGQNTQTISNLKNSNLYGNSGCIWKKILKHYTETKLKELKNFQSQIIENESYNKSINESLLIESSTNTNTTTNTKTTTTTTTTTINKSKEIPIHQLVSEIERICDKLTEKVLFPNGINDNYQNPFQQSIQEDSQLLIGDEAFQSNITIPKKVITSGSHYIPPDVIYQSDRLNNEINSHINAINKLREKQKSLLNINLDVMKIEAERYYADTMKASCASDSILKWSSVFSDGSGSRFSRELFHRSETLTPVMAPLINNTNTSNFDENNETLLQLDNKVTTNINSNQRQEFPLLEKRHLGPSITISQLKRPESAQAAIRQSSSLFSSTSQLPPSTTTTTTTTTPTQQSYTPLLTMTDFRRNKGISPNQFTPILENRRNKRFS